jgi:Txe/YoeB family toxin of toxin-antitoxin system
MRFQVFRQIVSMASVTLPVAGTVTNYNPLIAEGYAGKTGSDSAAGGCLAFFTDVTVGGRRQTAVGVVLGQGEGSDTSVILAAAGEAAMQLVDSVTPALRDPTGGIGKPEPLKYGIAGAWSRRITEEHRLVHQALDADIVVLQARYRYER